MKRILPFALSALVSCGGQVAAETSDAGSDTTSVADTFEFPLDVPPPIDVTPLETCAGVAIDLKPKDVALFIDTSTTPPTPATQSYTATLSGCTGPKDVTGEVALSFADPTLGTCTGNLCTSVASLPGGSWLAKTSIEASAEHAVGSAAITLVQVRRSGPHADAVFVADECGVVTPPRLVLRTSGALSSTVTTKVSSAPESAFDATALLEPIRAMTEGDPVEGCGAHPGSDTDGDGVVDTFDAVSTESVCFEIVARKGAPLGPSSSFGAAFVDFVAPADPSFSDRRIVVYHALPLGGPPC